MNLTKYVACICEGSAERAIIKLLLDENRLIFTWDDLLEGEILRCRNAKKFEEQHLRKGFTDKITVLRILDSRRERFKLSKAYASKIDVVNVITAPEIEMLVIFAEGKYDEYKKSKKKPSTFCKEDLKISDVKSIQFVESYFADIEVLISAIREYRRVSSIQRGEYALSDLLNE
ncbi:MAG: hypothetical protein J5569_02255 [Oscillospiraceae bacterium]|nr:hypothetical protein [Oscillospiraceae bacterium]